MVKKKKNNGYKKLLWEVAAAIIIILLVLAAIWFVYSKGWIPTFTKETFVEVPSTAIPGTTAPVDLMDNCPELCEDEGWTDGWESTVTNGQDCLDVGATYVKYGYPNKDPILECCCDNIPPVDENGIEIGDTVGSGGGSVILGDGGMETFEIQLTPGDYYVALCAEIERKSSKVVSGCNPTGDLEDWNEFVFLDSYGLIWERSDQIVAGVNLGPNTYGNPDILGVDWDGTTPFKMHLYHNGPCDMNMEMRVTIKAC